MGILLYNFKHKNTREQAFDPENPKTQTNWMCPKQNRVKSVCAQNVCVHMRAHASNVRLNRDALGLQSHFAIRYARSDDLVGRVRNFVQKLNTFTKNAKPINIFRIFVVFYGTFFSKTSKKSFSIVLPSQKKHPLKISLLETDWFLLIFINKGHYNEQLKEICK